MKLFKSTGFVILLSLAVLAAAWGAWRWGREKPRSHADGSLVVALEGTIPASDPRLIGGDANSQYIEELRFLPLVSFDEKGNRENVLIESIEPNSAQGWKIKLKSHVLFANGKELTAHDVVATYKTIQTPKEGFPQSPRKVAFENATFTAVTNDELNIALKTPDVSFLNNLVIGILPQEAVEKAAANQVNNGQYESGPFILTRFNAKEWTLVKNPKYSFEPKPTMEKIIFKVIPDASTRFAALVKGDVDIVQNSLDPDKITQIETDMPNTFQILKGTRLATTYLAFNFRNQSLQNENVRMAIGNALNIAPILQYRLHSNETAASSMFPSENFYFNAELQPFEFNPENAKKLLIDAQVPLPLKTKLFVSNNNRITSEAARVLAEDLNKVGFQVGVEALENSVFQQQIRNGNAPMWISTWVGFKDPDHLRFAFASNMTPPNGGNRGFFGDAEVDVLLEQGRLEHDIEKRKKIYDSAQQRLATLVPYVYLWHGQNTAVVANDVNGFRLYADGRYRSLVDVKRISLVKN